LFLNALNFFFEHLANTVARLVNGRFAGAELSRHFLGVSLVKADHREGLPIPFRYASPHDRGRLLQHFAIMLLDDNLAELIRQFRPVGG
jgi:hypothetical protein